MSDWTLSPRDADLGRTLDPLSGWTSLELVERLDGADTWTITGPAEAVDVFAPGMGCILDRDGEQIASGQLWSYNRVASPDRRSGTIAETVTLGFIADTGELATRQAWPDPARAIGATLVSQGRDADSRTGAREDLILAFVDANLGPGALPDRRLARLALPTSRGRGGATTVTARMTDLDALVQELAEAAGLRVRIVHDETPAGARLVLRIDERPDVSADVVFGPPSTPSSALVTNWTYHYEAPKLTRAVLGGPGEGAARLYARRIDADGEDMWARAREQTVNQGQAKDQAAADTAMDKALTSGVTVSSVKFDVADTDAVRYRRDYAIGSRVGLALPGLPDSLATEVVREAKTTVKRGAGPTEEVSVVVGSAGATGTSTRDAADLTQALQAIRTLERNR